MTRPGGSTSFVWAAGRARSVGHRTVQINWAALGLFWAASRRLQGFRAGGDSRSSAVSWLKGLQATRLRLTASPTASTGASCTPLLAQQRRQTEQAPAATPDRLASLPNNRSCPSAKARSDCLPCAAIFRFDRSSPTQLPALLEKLHTVSASSFRSVAAQMAEATPAPRAAFIERFETNNAACTATIFFTGHSRRRRYR